MSAAAVIAIDAKAAIAWTKIARTNVIRGKGLTPADKVVFQQANEMIQDGQEIVISRFAELCELSERTVQVALGKLVRLGLLCSEVVPGAPTEYSLPFHYIAKKPVENVSPGGADSEPTGGAKKRPGCGMVYTPRGMQEHLDTTKKDNAYPGNVENRKPKPQAPSGPPQTDEQAKREAIEQLKQRGVKTYPHRWILCQATPHILDIVLMQGDKKQGGPGLYVKILRDLMGFTPKPKPAPGDSPPRKGFQSSASLLEGRFGEWRE